MKISDTSCLSLEEERELKETARAAMRHHHMIKSTYKFYADSNYGTN